MENFQFILMKKKLKFKNNNFKNQFQRKVQAKDEEKFQC